MSPAPGADAPGAAVDLNADLGESFGAWRLGDDEGLLSVVTSANVACGFHAGDPSTMTTTCERAVAAGVVVGAQVSYRDLAGFGRRFIDYAPAELTADVVYQLGALDGIARAAGGRVAYVKPHGALYNAVVHHEGQAHALVEAVLRYDPTLPLLGLPGSLVLQVARAAGLTTVAEAFADRAYTDAGTLVPRGEPGAVLHDPDEIAARVLRLVTEGVVRSLSGTDVVVRAGSVCVHGDTPGAVVVARSVRAALDAAGRRVVAFA